MTLLVNPSEIAKACGQHQVLIPTPWVHKHGVSSEPVPRVHNEMVFFVDISGKGSLFENAKSISQERNRPGGNADLFGLKLAVMVCEDDTAGTPHVSVSRTENRALYRSVLEAISANMGVGKKKENHRIILSNNTGPSLYFSPQTQVDLEATKEYYKNKKENKSVSRNRGGGASSNQEQEQQQRKRIRKQNAAREQRREKRSRTVVSEWLQKFREQNRKTRRVFGGTISLEGDISYGQFPGNDSSIYWTQDDGEPEPEPEDDYSSSSSSSQAHVDDEPVALGDAVPNNNNNSNSTRPPLPGRVDDPPRPKIQLTITPLPRSGGDPKKELDIVGYIYRFLILDKTLNPGDVAKKIIRAVADRNKNKLAKKRFYDEKYPTYMKYSGSDHPAVALTPLRYVKMRKDYIGDIDSNNDEKEARFVINAYSNELHMCNIFTLERALSRAREAGADPTYCDYGVWEDNDNGSGTFPQDLETFCLAPQQVFWTHPNWCGLSELYFPNLSKDNHFMEALKNNGNIERFLKSQLSVYETREAAHDELEKELSRLDILLRDTRVISRNEVLKNNLVTYETYNEFIHVAAEADAVEGKIMKYFPSDFPDLWRRTRYYVSRAGVDWQTFLPLISSEEAEEHPLVRQLIKKYGLGRWRDHAYVDLGDKLSIDEIRELVDSDLEQIIETYERYCAIRQKSDEHATKKFETLIQLDGDIEGLPIPDTIKAMLKNFRDKWSKTLPHLSKSFCIFDPELGIFGNSQIFMTRVYAKFAKIVQPIICILSEGLLSCYEWCPKTLKWNMLLHGEHDGGKTYAGIKTLVDFSTIPGTVVEQTSETAAVATSQHHYDEIRAADEAESCFINLEDAKKNKDRVNTEKVARTRGQVTRERYVKATLPSGETVNWSQRDTKDQHITRIEISNETVQPDNPINSRTFPIMVKKNNIPTNELAQSIPAIFKSDSRTWCQINQFLSALAKKYNMVGGLRAPYMGIFMDYSNVVIQILRRDNTLDQTKQARPLEIMLPYARQLVYRTAIQCAFDMPAGECYQKEFQVTDLKKIEPYLYADEEIIWWTWTACGGLWVMEDRAVVIEALKKLAKLELKGDDTITQAIERVGVDGVGIKETRNQYWKEGDPDGNRMYVDLNYQVVQGSLRQIAVRGSMLTPENSKIDVENFEAILKQLADVNYNVVGGAYEKQPKGWIQDWFPYNKVEEDPDDPGEMRRAKKTGMLPANFLKHRASREVFSGHWLTERDLPKANADLPIPVIDLSDIRDGKLYFVPNAGDRFKKDVIEKALFEAGLRPSLVGPELKRYEREDEETPQNRKFLLGVPMERDPTLFYTCSFPKQRILDAVKRADESVGWHENPETHELEYCGTETEKENIPIPRAKGMVFNRRCNINSVDEIILTSVPIAPKKADDTEWKSIYKSSIAKMSKMVEIVDNPDDYSAIMQWGLCAMPLTGTPETRKHIMDKNNAIWKQKNRPLDRDIDYPIDYINEALQQDRMWNNRNASKKMSKSISSAWDEMTKDNLNQRRRRRRRKKRNSEDLGNEISLSVPTMRKTKKKNQALVLEEPIFMEL